MFIAGLRHLDRTRGTGWLDCPNCHEHAAQDVVDDMSFLQVLFYRFSPVTRKRMLVCRRCRYRRPATAEELKHLETAGQPIHRALMAPMGVLGLAVVGGIVGLVAWIGQSSANALANQHINLVKESGQAVPITFDGPSAWNYDPSTDPVPSMREWTGAATAGLAAVVSSNPTTNATAASRFMSFIGFPPSAAPANG